MSSADDMSNTEESLSDGLNKASDKGTEDLQEVKEETPEPMAKGDDDDDLSDVSDLESHDGLQESTVASPHKTMQDQLETELDFEAEEKDEEQKKEDKAPVSDGECDAKSEGEVKDGDNDLEEGECTDAEDARPEEESKPICRFYNRGQCTWGANCRFVHPGVTDKGNYTMFDMVRPLVPTNGPSGSDQYFEKSAYGAAAADGPPLESAWERGLRHAKEMMKKATRRKETDMDFEEKKMNLSLGQEDLDKENDFYTRPASPIYRFEDNGEKRSSRDEEYYAQQDNWHRSHESSSRQLENYYKQRQHRDLRDTLRDDRSGGQYREVSHSPESSHSRNHPSSKHRERDEKGRSQPKGRADDWSDPWMRQKSPTRKSAWKRSHSSDSSISSSSGSSDSGSSSSSASSYSGHSHSAKKSKHEVHSSKSSKYEKSAPVSKSKEMPPPAKRRPPPPETSSKKPRMPTKDRYRKRSSSGHSNSNSSLSSSSEDEQSYSKSSKADKKSDFVTKTKAMDAMKLSGQKQQIKLTLRENETQMKADSLLKKKAANPAALLKDVKANDKKAVTRREELLKQLKAVEDAIRRKKTKPT